MATTNPPTTDALDGQLSGLDALELELRPPRRRSARIWAHVWPKALAAAIFLAFWQIVVWTGWRPEYLLPGPVTVFQTLFSHFSPLLDAARTTLGRAVQGFSLAIVIGTVLGAVVARSRVLRAAFGSLITGLQTMPSIAWFPLAILLFRLTNGAIIFVVGVVIDALLFGTADRAIRRRYGHVDESTAA